MTHGPQTAASDAIHAMKYRAPGESFREAMNRVACALKDSDEHFHALRDMLLDQRFVPAGRIQAAIGLTKSVTAYNCFVSLPIADSFVDDPGCIMDRAKEAATTMRMGGGIGYDFSTLRPRGDVIKKLSSTSTGPVSFMRIYDAICLATSSAGHRRGAQMGILRVDHPSIEEFVKAKQNAHNFEGFNISVAVTNEFMEAALNEKPFTLRFNGNAYNTISAASLWESIMRSTWDWGEPGVIFIDRINELNNLWYCETIAATNPCSEQPLPPGGACLLGSINLVKYITTNEQNEYSFDFDQLTADIPIAVRALDNVIDRTVYPLDEQRQEALSKRRMGIGVMGLANCLETLGYPYGSNEFIESESRILEWITLRAYESSALLAAEKGPFPLFDCEKYLRGVFISKHLPKELHTLISRIGIRNSHLTSIAPTGTISQTCDNVSGGIEPVWQYAHDRPVNTPTGLQMFTIKDYALAQYGVQGRLAHDVSPIEHVDVLTTAQQFVDSGISKTVNVSANISWDSFKDVYRQAWENGAKSCATFTYGGKRESLLKAEGGSCRIDATTGERSCEG